MLAVIISILFSFNNLIYENINKQRGNTMHISTTNLQCGHNLYSEVYTLLVYVYETPET